MESVGLVALWYMIQIENPKIRPFLQQIEVELYKTAEHDNFSELYSFYMYGDEVDLLHFANFNWLFKNFPLPILFFIFVFIVVIFNCNLRWQTMK